MDLIKHLTEGQLKENACNFNIGDTVRVHAKIKEGSRERIQVFEGTVLAKKHGGIRRRSPSAGSPMASAWKRPSPSILPTWRSSRS